MEKTTISLCEMVDKTIYRVESEHHKMTGYVEAQSLFFNYVQKPESLNKTSHQPYGPQLAKYLQRRHFLFKKFDEGIQYDEQSLYSIVGEDISLHINHRLKQLNVCKVCEPFCGVGGIAVHLADNFEEYVVNDIDLNKLKMLEHNMNVYKKNKNKLKIQNLDFLKMEPFSTDAIILCPPWGGTNITDYKTKDLDDLISPKLSLILEHAVKFTNNIILQLPKTTQVQSLMDIAMKCKGLNPLFTIQRVYRNQSKLDQLFIYFGDLRFTGMKSQVYQMIYDDLHLKRKDKKSKRRVKQKLKTINNSVFCQLQKRKIKNQ